MKGKPNVQGGLPSEVDTAQILLGTIGDTTWRMFVPSVGFTLVGVWLDTIYATKPWLMIIGVMVGFVMAVVLVRRQIGIVRQKQQKDSVR